MQQPYKSSLITVGSIVFGSLVLSFIFNEEFSVEAFSLFYGLIGLLSGVICLIAALTILLTNKEKQQTGLGFLLSAGVLLLTCFFALSQVEFSR